MKNWSLFSAILDSSTCFKMISQLLNFPAFKLTSEELMVTFYECKKEIKFSQKSKEKNYKPEYQMITVEADQKDVMFMYTAQKLDQNNLNLVGNLTLANKSLFESVELSKIFGERKEAMSQRIVVERYQWESYFIQIVPLPDSSKLIFIQESNSLLTISTRDNLENEIQKKISIIFENLLEILMPSHGEVVLKEYHQQLKKIIRNCPLLVREINKGLEINFQLLSYYLIATKWKSLASKNSLNLGKEELK